LKVLRLCAMNRSKVFLRLCTAGNRSLWTSVRDLGPLRGAHMARESINPGPGIVPEKQPPDIPSPGPDMPDPPEPNPDLPPEDQTTDPDVPPPSGPPVFPQ